MTRPSFPKDDFRAAHSPDKKTKIAQNVLGSFAALSVLFCISAPSKELPDARDLVARSLEAGQKNQQQLRAYVGRTRTVARQLAPDGSLKSEEIKTFDDVLVDGFHVRKLVAKNDKPLAGQDRLKEEGRIAKLVAQRKRESPEVRERLIADAKEKHEKDRRFSNEIAQAFDFKVTGEETVKDRKTWVLDATPHPGYKPSDLKAQVFPHLHGTVWIDQQDLLWVKADASAFEAFSIGFSALAKLDKGAHLSFHQARLDDGTWVNSDIAFTANARLAMMKHISIDYRSTSDNYRKVPPETRITDGKDEF